MPRLTRTLLAALVCLATAGLGGCTSDPAPRDAAVLTGALRTAQDPVPDSSTEPGQTSEGIEGELVQPYPEGFSPRAVVSNVRRWSVVPGVTYRRWRQVDARGPVRAHLLRADLGAAGVSLDYQSMPYVQERDRLTDLLRLDGRAAVAGVNGGFFDIADTGAPLGVGEDRQRGFLHASLMTWNNAFYLDHKGVPRIGRLEVAARIDQLPQHVLTNVNSPRVREGSIGLYTPEWGTTSGYSITDGQRRNVRMVVIQDGRVVVNRTTLTAGQQITGTVLVGRGPGASALSEMPVGSSASTTWTLPRVGRMAISGERVLLRDGKRLVEDDRELHPRTAVGIDRDTGKVLLLVVDGRQDNSRGYTLVELARLMRSLGAEDALNLDGGGSSTLVARDEDGDRRVLNSPSDGSQRSVADGIGVHYSKPAG